MTTNVTNHYVAPSSGRETFTVEGEITLDLANGSPVIIWIGNRRIEISSASKLTVLDEQIDSLGAVSP